MQADLKKHLPLAVALLLSLLVAVPARAQETPVELPVIKLTAGINVIRAEIAANDRDREKGLMFRTKLGSNQGMAFLFDDPGKVCMWMKNTLIPLSVAFMDESGHIMNVEDMAPQTETNHCSAGTARYALEMNLGWFTAHGVRPGMVVSGLPSHR
jgi:uncharacterized membrane protein (UPF0127 family)